jgi:DNA-binding transcriptional LysR family regulator
VLCSITLVNISGIDLNLLHVLHVVLQEQSATRAAKRLHVTQSAVSNALGRLRLVFADALVVRNARGLSPTPRALALQPTLAGIMASVDGLVSSERHFDPSTTTRELTLACADYFSVGLAPRLAQLLEQRAPLARLRLFTLEQLSSSENLATTVDVHVGMPPRIPSGCRSATLFDDRFVCMVRREHRKASPRFTLKDYLAATHVRVSVLGSTQDPIDVALEARGHSRRIALTLPHFSVLASVVELTGYVATLSRRLVALQSRRFDVSLRDPPISLGSRPTRMIWHERTEADEGARFFRQLIKDACDVSQ